jgi:hypothetical protein
MASARAVALEVVGVEQIPPLAARPAVEEVLVVVPDPTLGVGCGQGRTGAHLIKGRGADQLGPPVLGDGDGEPVGQGTHLALEICTQVVEVQHHDVDAVRCVPEGLEVVQHTEQTGGRSRLGRRRVVVDPSPEALPFAVWSRRQRCHRLGGDAVDHSGSVPRR